MIESEVARVVYISNGTTGPFSIPFSFIDDADIDVVLVTVATGVEQTLILNIDYTLVNTGTGGTLTTSVAYGSSLFNIVIAGDPPLTQTVDLLPNGKFPADRVESALDKLTRIAQQLKNKLAKCMSLPLLSSASSTFPPPGAGSYIRWNVVGTALEAVSAAPDLGVFTQSGAGAVSRTWTSKVGEVVSVFDFMTSAEISAVKGYTYATDVTAKIQAAMNAAFSLGLVLIVPAGGYKVTTLDMPGNSASRGKPFVMQGTGIGEVFATVQGATGATIFRNTASSSSPVFRYVPDIVNTGNGFASISGITFWGNTTAGVAIIDFDSFYSQSRMFDCSIIQDGAGDGLVCNMCATPEFFNIYSINNPGWVTSSGGGVFTRTGTGFKFTCSLVGGAGLLKVRGTTSRGWDTGYQIGDGINPILTSSLRDFECSNTKHGVKVMAFATGTTINGGYFEGGDGGIGILDNSDYTTISDNVIYPGYGTVIDASSSYVGTTITGNTLSAGSIANTKIVKLASSGALGGQARTFLSNSLTFSGSGGSIVGVVGIEITGVDPQLFIAGNDFQPRGAWVGGAGTQKISNTSTSGESGSRARGDFGFGIVASGGYNYPALHRGVVSLAQLPTITTTSATVTIAAPDGGFYDVTFAAAQNINKIAEGGQEGRIVWLNVTNGNVTFVHNANLKLAGAVNWTPGANGGILILRMYSSSGGFINAQEIGRVAY